MTFRSLYAKLAVVLLGLLAVVGLLFVSISVYSTGTYQQEVNRSSTARLRSRSSPGKSSCATALWMNAP